MRIFCHPPASKNLKDSLTEHEFFEFDPILRQGEDLKSAYVQLMYQLAQIMPDVVIISVQSFDTLKIIESFYHLFKHQTRPAFILTSLDEKFAYQAYQLGVDGYLLEPISHQNLQKLLLRLTQPIQTHVLQNNSVSQQPAIITKNMRGLQRVLLQDVYCIITDQKYLRLYHRYGNCLVDDTLKNLQEKFKPSLLRIHRNALIQPNYTKAIDCENGKSVLILQDVSTGFYQKLPISRRLLPCVKKELKHRFLLAI